MSENAAPNLDELPISRTRTLPNVDCCGYLIVRPRGDEAEILCNECGVVVRRVPIAEVYATITELVRTDTICSATCPHCGAVNSFPNLALTANLRRTTDRIRAGLWATVWTALLIAAIVAGRGILRTSTLRSLRRRAVGRIRN